MLLSDFDFDLPAELIAQQAPERGTSRMMLLDPVIGFTQHLRFADFPAQLRAGDLLVLNDTRVLPARLLAAPNGNMTRPIELLLIRELEPLQWEAWCKPARRVNRGDTLHFADDFKAVIEEKKEDGSVVVRFSSASEEAFWLQLDRFGSAPLPPYIRRDSAATPSDSDKDAYQTVYADQRGAVAAPTAGLHFTSDILERIAAAGVEVVRITLHVGIGTFKPVKVVQIADHRMDREHYQISAEAAEALNAGRREGRRIVAVGTTSTRALESALRESDYFTAGSFETDIFMTPGYSFKAVDALLTNFHLPRSTLLMLVSAFAGVDFVREAYALAIKDRYRFYSYGDCMFIVNRAGALRAGGRGPESDGAA